MQSIKLHTANIYQKPKIGNTWLRTLPAYNYKHSINAIGWYDTASFDIALRSVDEMQTFLNQNLGNRIAIYVENPVVPVWEGFINRMTFSGGNVQYSISLEKMANRLSTIASVGGVTSNTAKTNDTTSQAIYGIKEDNVELGYQQTAGTITTVLRDTQLAQRAWPKTSMVQGQGQGLLHVECLGFWHTLRWELYTNNTSALAAYNTFITTFLLPAVANGTTFFDNTDFTDIAANAATVNRQKVRGQTFVDILEEIQESGDASNYWTIGITPTLYSTATRRLYYQQANSAIEYTARQSDGLRVRNLYGQIVPPWEVVPDRGVRISDMLIGWDGIGDNPAETYILKVDYDANAQTAIFSGDDDLTAEGVFNLKRYNLAYGKRFGAPRRLL